MHTTLPPWWCGSALHCDSAGLGTARMLSLRFTYPDMYIPPLRSLAACIDWLHLAWGGTHRTVLGTKVYLVGRIYLPVHFLELLLHCGIKFSVPASKRVKKKKSAFREAVHATAWLYIIYYIWYYIIIHYIYIQIKKTPQRWNAFFIQLLQLLLYM